MKTRTRIFIGGLAALLSLTGAARAEDSKRVELSVLGGAALPTSEGDLGKADESALIKASLMWQALPAMAIGLELGYAPEHTVNLNLPWGYSFGMKYQRNVLQVTPEIQFGKWIGALKPYLTFGGGLYRIREKFSVEAFGLGFSHSFADDYAGINAGLGLLVKLNDSVAIGPDIRYHHILTDFDEYHYLDATARLAFRF